MSKLNLESITATEVFNFLRKKGKTRFWFHNLGARHHLLPPPIIKPTIAETPRDKKLNKYLPAEIKEKLRKLKGRTVFYPKQLIAYLELIINLKDEKNFTFEQIIDNDEVQRELKKLKYLVLTDLYTDPLVREEGFFINFKVAKRFLLERKGVGTDRLILDFINQLPRDLAEKAKKYYEVNKQIRDSALGFKPISKALEEEKGQLACVIGIGHKIMEVIIKIGVDMLKKKKITQEEWFRAVKELETEEQGGVGK